MIDDFLGSIATSAWALPVMFLLVFADALLVVIPGEVAVTALGAISADLGTPPLVAVVACAAVAAFLGDAVTYHLGRRVGLDRWRWMRGPRVSAALSWARGRLHASSATVVFTARFIPFARLAVNLTAGATRVPAPRYLGMVAIAATAWAAYQAAVGAIVAHLLPGGPLVAVIVSIAAAIGLGILIDLIVARIGRRTPRADADSTLD